MRRRDTRVLGNPAHRRHASRQLHRRGAAVGRHPAARRLGRRRRPRRGVLRRRPARAHHALRPGRARRRDPPPRHAPARRRARPAALHRLRAEPSARARGAHLAAQLHRNLRRAAAHDAVQGQGRTGGLRRTGVVVGRLLRLPGADGLRHRALRRRRRPGRRRPAPARRAHARCRGAFQPPVRRGVQDPEGDVRAVRRADHGSAEPGEQDVEVGGLAPGLDRRARGPEGDHQEDQVGGHRLRDRGASRPRREAGRVESHRDPRRGDRPQHRRRSSSSSPAAATARFKAAVADAVVEYLRPVQARYAELAADPGEVDRLLAVGAERRRNHRRPGARPRLRAAGLPPPRATRSRRGPARRVGERSTGTASARFAGHARAPSTSPRSLPVRPAAGSPSRPPVDALEHDRLGVAPTRSVIAERRSRRWGLPAAPCRTGRDSCARSRTAGRSTTRSGAARVLALATAPTSPRRSVDPVA